MAGDEWRRVTVAASCDLPIFRQDGGEHCLFYAPGCLCLVAGSQVDRFEATLDARRAPGGRWQAELRQRARSAQRAAASAAAFQGPFSPECLTLYLNNECALRCVYCYADPSPQPDIRLDLDAIAAAGELVAENCRRQGRPFYMVFHGGGEPALHPELLEAALARLEAIGAAHEVRPFRYVATNGVLPEERVAWLAHHFDLVGLSCDGPADLQDRQRPRWGGESTSRSVERAARILREEGGRFHVRATVTSAGLQRLPEIAEYLCQELAPEEIHLEPVYRGGRAGVLGANLAGEFAAQILAARQVAGQYGIDLAYEGGRLDSVHAPYCHVFRRVLNLVPGGVATACFKLARAARAEEQGAVIGAMNRMTGRFEIDQVRVQALCRELSAVPAACAGCVNGYHCTRGCPDRCPLAKTAADEMEPGFRCLANKALAQMMLAQAAGRLRALAMAGVNRDGDGVYGTTNF